MLSCGIDVGTSQTKCVIMDGNEVVHGRGHVHSASNLPRATRHALRKALMETGCEEYDLTIVTGTGFGRFTIPFSHFNTTESACHAKGAIYLYPETRTVLDSGGQNLTAIKIDSTGRVLDFAMNDKCAAGSGRFLESVADLLGLTMAEIVEFESTTENPVVITNVCSVLADQEVLNHLEGGEDRDEVLSGVITALARRGASLVKRIGVEEELTMTGGISRVKSIVKCLGQMLGTRINSGTDGVYIGAIGAALTGLERAEKRT